MSIKLSLFESIIKREKGKLPTGMSACDCLSERREARGGRAKRDLGQSLCR
ncbi:TPA: hypothetical protein HA242_06815 [Candidatus Woesearchaeota archaeon]|nr:hypothetical protein [Candidatus Woesearchaeota archaeon]